MSQALEQLSDAEIRENVRAVCSMWLEHLSCEGDVVKQLDYKKKFINKLKNSPIAIETDLANSQHYEVATNFFLRVLGPKLKYSCTYWPEGCNTLEQSEKLFFDLLFERTAMKDGLTVLDLGCGWGTTSLEILDRYPNAKVYAVSNSNSQRVLIQNVARNRGHQDRIVVITSDANFFTPPAGVLFDRVISVEMFEHMKNYQELMSRISTWLKPDGFLFVHILCHYKYTYPFIAKEGTDAEWMAKNFFSGGTMPSSDLLLYFQQYFSIENIWLLNGTHYGKTLEAWLARMDAQKKEILEIFRADQPRRVNTKLPAEESEEEILDYWKKWRTFFLFCSEVFNFNNGNDWMVAHYLFSKKALSKL